jgi:hypothetical protein
MSRLVEFLVLAAALAATAAQASSGGAIPRAVFPTLPAEAQSAPDLVPNGWAVEEEARGDLNGDGVPDLLLLLRDTKPENVIAGDGQGAGPFDTNPRLLAVAFADEATNTLSLALANHSLIPRHTDPLMEDPLGDVSIVRGTLQVSLGVWVSAGSWTTSNRKLTFRHQDGCFKLIGYDAMDFQRNTGKMSKVSVNYLTKKANRSWGYADDAMNDFSTSAEAADLLCLEAVGDGLDFAGPSTSSSSRQAADRLKAAAEAEPRWTTTIDSLRVGSGDQSATFDEVRSTCSATKLTQALGTTASEFHDCLNPTMTVHVTVAFAGGQLASKIEPDDEGTYCVSTALDRAHFDDLTCTFDANVSSP